MNKTLVKGLIVTVGLIDFAVSGYFTYAARERVRSLPELPPRAVASEHPTDQAAEHGGGHGAAPAAEHGGGHGAAAPTAPEVPSKLRSWVTMEEMYVNVLSEGVVDTHTISFKLEVELFDESSRKVMDEHQALVKNAILEVARTQQFDELRTLAGKLYFKEALVGKINETVHYPLIRDIHLSSFALR
jgi:flagellar basal body-associated protein FliL